MVFLQSEGDEKMVFENRPSLLSSENVSNNPGYRGVLNLSILLLIMTHLRLILENLVRFVFETSFTRSHTEEIHSKNTAF